MKGFGLRFGIEPPLVPETDAAETWAAAGTRVGPLRKAPAVPLKVGAEGVKLTVVLGGELAAAMGIEIPLSMSVASIAKVVRVFALKFIFSRHD
jgi:hypothetical protein